jgi:predicted DsbA family dithiol-disulfide isomerase
VVVEMTSDSVCPWCYIGKRRLERAVAQLDPTVVRVELRHRPFFLDASLPLQSVDKSEWYRKRFGEERAKLMQPRMTALGLQEGIHFSYGGRIGSTLLSHRLLRRVERLQPELTARLVDRLFAAYFEEEQDIADAATLARAAVSVGVREDEAALVAYLQGNEDEASVQLDIISAYRNGIDGVPHFRIDGQYEVPGAEQPEVFMDVFRKLGVC